MSRAEFLLPLAGLIFIFSAATALPAAEPSDFGEAIVAAPDRNAEDLRLDERRHPAQLLDFSGVKPGMKVLDMMAGGGYTTELLARAVGGSGRVYAQSRPGGPEKSHQALVERMARPAMTNVVLAETPLEAPVPDGSHDFDLVTLILNYHDITYLPVDRAKMNRAMFDCLKPGGALVIVDHAANPGAGTTVGKSLHRIEESALIAEVEAAGFKKAAEADFLRQPGDPRDQPFFNMDSPTDQFVLKFVKP